MGFGFFFPSDDLTNGIALYIFKLKPKLHRAIYINDTFFDRFGYWKHKLLMKQ
jgi:hypothetical protein